MILFFAIFALLWASYESGLRIIGGRDALQDEFPYVVSLEKKIDESRKDTIINYEHLCTGAALTSVWVLSAAHCVDESVSNQLYITEEEIFVRYNSYFPKIAGHIAPIIKFVIHPGYVEGGEIIKQFDVLLVRCIEMKISNYGRVNAVEYTSLVGQEAFSLGYGGTNASYYEKPLQVLKGMLYKCTEEDIKEMTPHMICLSRPCSVEATICGGDSGGPVVHASGIVGVHSMSFDDCDEHTKHLKLTPGTSAAVISPVSIVIDWITMNVIEKVNK